MLRKNQGVNSAKGTFNEKFLKILDEFTFVVLGLIGGESFWNEQKLFAMEQKMLLEQKMFLEQNFGIELPCVAMYGRV